MTNSSKRFIAFFIDAVLTAFFTFAGMALLNADDFNALFADPGIMASRLPGMLAGFIAFFLLRDILGRGPGKLICGLRVYSADNGKPACWRLILRNITTVIWPIEGLVILLSDSHRRLSDRVLKLYVK